jgi:hypothetical protein
MVLLVNLKIDKEISFPIFQGRYAEFSVEWYRLVGASLCVQMILMVVSGLMAGLLELTKGMLKRCYDRGCTMNKRRTRKLTQAEYEAVNCGPEISYEEIYSSMLVVILMAMTYGPGLPVMYPIACVYFAVAYWKDKFLFFYHHKKPVFFDEKLALQITSWFKLGLFFHLAMGVLMFSNANILPLGSTVDTLDKNWGKYGLLEKVQQRFSFGTVDSPQLGLFVACVGLVLIVYLTWSHIVKSTLKLIELTCKTRFSQTKLKHTEITVEKDIFACVNHSYLKRVYEECDDQLKKAYSTAEEKNVKFADGFSASGWVKLCEEKMKILKEAIKRRAKEDLTAPGEFPADGGENFHALFEICNKNMQANKDNDQKVEGDLISYNMMQNDKYQFIDKLKKILDVIKERKKDLNRSAGQKKP